ncbi:MAG TPA: VOC family protein [Kribbellaceae bacterium]|jgi:predicted enzyme related to lactoylglutathione lyase
MRIELTLDCNDLDAQARFWAAALGRTPSTVVAGRYVALDPAGGVPLTLQRVAEPKRAKNRLHLDLLVDDVDAEVDRLLRLGARRLADHEDYGTRWSVLCDPEGNEFCVGSG